METRPKYHYALVHKDEVNSHLERRSLMGERVVWIHRNERAAAVDILTVAEVSD